MINKVQVDCADHCVCRHGDTHGSRCYFLYRVCVLKHARFRILPKCERDGCSDLGCIRLVFYFFRKKIAKIWRLRDF